MDSYLYVIGGLWHYGVDKNGHILRPIRYAVRFNSAAQKWEKIASLQLARYGACGARAWQNFHCWWNYPGALPCAAPEVITETCEMPVQRLDKWMAVYSKFACTSQEWKHGLPEELSVCGGWRSLGQRWSFLGCISSGKLRFREELLDTEDENTGFAAKSPWFAMEQYQGCVSLV